MYILGALGILKDGLDIRYNYCISVKHFGSCHGLNGSPNWYVGILPIKDDVT